MMSLIAPTQAESVTPNAVFTPSISISATIRDGKLVTSALISLAQAEVKNHGNPDENWKQGVKTGWMQIDDIRQLPDDLAPLQRDINGVYAAMIQLLAAANAIRRIV